MKADDEHVKTDDASASISVVSSGNNNNNNNNNRTIDESLEMSASPGSYGGGSGGFCGGSSGTPAHTSTNNTTTHNNNLKKVHEYASKETKRVNRWRIFVLLTILSAGIGVSTCTYLVLQREIQKDCQRTFDVTATTIQENFQYEIYNKIFETNRAFSRSITTTAIMTNQQFPFVQLGAFEARAYDIRKESKFLNILYAPIVSYNKYNTWLNFSFTNKNWINESYAISNELLFHKQQQQEGTTQQPQNSLFIYELLEDESMVNDYNHTGTTVWSINEENDEFVPWDHYNKYNDDIFVPSFYSSPPPQLNKNNKNVPYQNINLFSLNTYKSLCLASDKMKDVVFSSIDSELARLVGYDSMKNTATTMPPTVAVQPIYAKLGSDNDDKVSSSNNDVVGYIFSVLEWDQYLRNLLPNHNDDKIVLVDAVLRNTCGQQYTFQLTADELIPTKVDDLTYNSLYNNHKRSFNFSQYYVNTNSTQTVEGHCEYGLDIYPSAGYEEECESNLPIIFTVVMAVLFVIMAGMFFTYDRFVQTRNAKVALAAARSNAIVSSLFPSNVRERLMEEQEVKEKEAANNHNNTRRHSTLRGYLTGYEEQDNEVVGNEYKTKPIADLFPETTLFFGDIAGFTAWSSVREPAQVFTLLETIYHSFDQIAKRRRIFKVETVGDCYVAVAGLPDPRQDHAVVMARFARDCMVSMSSLSKKLETKLGPDTGELSMRIGLHSGPVTAGVLRGERSRFQLFGDTMNTCARIETNGHKGRIHMSEETANLLISAGKKAWVKPREDRIYAKGKGELKTFWLNISSRAEHSSNTEGSAEVEAPLADPSVMLSDKTVRLVAWNVEVLMRLLKQIVVRRNASGVGCLTPPDERFLLPSPGKLVLDEVKEIITLPTFDAKVSAQQEFTSESDLDPNVVEQLTNFISRVAAMYRNNPFHNFDHASHVTMSVVKLLSRIVAPSESDSANISGTDASSLHDHTYGITSDPLTQFACVLSALIHDLDHPGVPNAQLVKEKSLLASAYQEKSIAEQNSVDLAFALLMEDQFLDLRRTIYTDDTEMKRFRQLVVNAVMATDIVDKELKALRNARWEKAFTEKSLQVDESDRDQVNRKATIVIEHLIQASDVAHTMQHWHIYRKWNEQFFIECYEAFRNGRAESDPSIHWFKGEIGFFDFYIIPLAKKLKDCGVFGVSSDEYLNYATKNRAEWECRGQEIVAEMVNKVNKMWNEKESAQQAGIDSES